VEKKQKKEKARRTLKPKTAPFSEAKPRKRQRVAMFGEELLEQNIGTS
jgi:hypothetical protein